jgi:Fe-Mn family superoxide dismutase
MLSAAAAAARRVAVRSATRRTVASSAAALPTLDYDYAALQPAISAQIMEIHHSKHHATYVNNYNAAIETYADAERRGDIAGMIALQGAIKFNGGGACSSSAPQSRRATLCRTHPKPGVC